MADVSAIGFTSYGLQHSLEASDVPETATCSRAGYRTASKGLWTIRSHIPEPQEENLPRSVVGFLVMHAMRRCHCSSVSRGGSTIAAPPQVLYMVMATIRPVAVRRISVRSGYAYRHVSVESRIRLGVSRLLAAAHRDPDLSRRLRGNTSTGVDRRNKISVVVIPVRIDLRPLREHTSPHTTG